MSKRVRTVYRGFWLTEQEWSLIEANIKRLGYYDFSKYTRKMLIEGRINVVSHFEVEAIKEITVELSRIGNNINQIARIANSTSTVFKAEVHELLENQTEMMHLLRKILDEHRRLEVN